MPKNNKNKISTLENLKFLKHFETKQSLIGLFGLAAFICLFKSSDVYLNIALVIIVILCVVKLYDWISSFKKAKLLVIKCTSFANTECDQPLPKHIYKKYGKIKEIRINQCKYTKNNSVTNLVKSYKKLQKAIYKISKKLSGTKYHVALCARCHIPFMFYLGCNLSTLYVKFFELSRHGGELVEIGDTPKSFPGLNIYNHLVKGCDILNILISVSVKINPKDIPDLSSYIELFLDEPHFDAIKCTQQLDNYSSQILSILNDCQKNHIKYVNIYYAGPMSLAFKMGQIVKLTMHPDIYIYNFSNTDSPNYGWALKLSNNFDKNNIIDTRLK